MIHLDNVTVSYPGSTAPALREVNLHIREGELALVIGTTGSGKSTLLKSINGLTPHFTGGHLSGRVLVADRDTRSHRPRDLADVVGSVLQDPRDGFVAEIVEDEIAYGMESIGIETSVMRRRVEESLDLLGLTEVRQRPLRTLSGGQQQRTAIAAVLAQHPQVLVLDEPTSALDPAAAEEVLAALQRIVHDLGLTVVLAEHRLERVVQFADRVIHVEQGRVEAGEPGVMMATSNVAPPVVELARLTKWNPIPLSVRDARRSASGLRDTLAAAQLDAHKPTVEPPRAAPKLLVDAVIAGYGNVPVLRELSLAVHGGETVALMGRNGAGKSTLLRTLVGLTEPDAGSVEVSGVDPADLSPAELLPHICLVPQEPADLLWTDSVARECRQADLDGHAPSGAALELFAQLAPGVVPTTHPRDLSEGQRMALAIAIMLAASSDSVLLDEPTRGLDYATKRRLVAILKQRAADGCAVIVATHDVELVAEVATRTVVMADGEVVADGPTAEVIVGSPQFAPQVAKVFAPLPFLTVAGVADAISKAG